MSEKLAIDNYRKKILSSYAYILVPLNHKDKIPLWDAFIPGEACHLLTSWNIEEAALPVLDIIDYHISNPHMLLLGDPGSGKSTLMRYLAVQWAREKYHKFPILVELHKYAGYSQNLMELLLNKEVCCLEQEQLLQQWQSGESLAMFDGLNQICNLKTKEKIIKEIVDFSHNYPKVQIIVTSQRIDRSLKNFKESGFATFELQNRYNEKSFEKNNSHTCSWQNKEAWDKFKDRALCGKSQIRQKALKELAHDDKNHPNTILFLKEQALQDPCWTVRYVAIQEIARGWHNHKGIWAFLKHRAIYEKDGSVIFAAVTTINMWLE